MSYFLDGVEYFFKISADLDDASDTFDDLESTDAFDEIDSGGLLGVDRDDRVGDNGLWTLGGE